MSDSEIDQATDDPGAETPASTDVVVTDEPQDESDESIETESGRRRLDWTLIIPCFVIACGLTAIVWGVSAAQTGSDGIDRPDAIEGLSPVENAQQVVQQEQVVVDLQFGYDAVFVIDGIELPTTRIGEFSGDLSPDEAGVQVETPPTAVFDPGNSRLEFRPTEGALIESFTEGRHEVQVIFWKVTEQREETARSYRWSFDVV